ncbi:MAG: hypothetical protein ACJAWL_003493 [Motiliproteus sp.]|jgi:hypothetical protein
MKLKTLVVTAILAAVSVSSAFAAENDAPGSGPNPFTDCGIGAALFKDVYWAAVTSNIIWDLGTTAVTSATASPETCNANKVETAQFILDTYENLAEETAMGKGEHLTAALNKFGCQAAAHGEVSGAIRQQMALEVSQPAYTGQSAVEKATAYYQALDTAAAGHCSV